MPRKHHSPFPFCETLLQQKEKLRPPEGLAGGGAELWVWLQAQERQQTLEGPKEGGAGVLYQPSCSWGPRSPPTSYLAQRWPAGFILASPARGQQRASQKLALALTPTCPLGLGAEKGGGCRVIENRTI